MKKLIIAGTLILILTLVLAFPVSATKPLDLLGNWYLIVLDKEKQIYDLDGTFEGTVYQPHRPGRAQKGEFSGTVADSEEGTCILNVVGFGPQGKTFKVCGHWTTLHCTGGLKGLHAWGAMCLIGEVPWGPYFGKYHFDG